MSAKKLKAARRRSGLSQARAAEACSVSLRSWQYYEAGKIIPRQPMIEWYISCLNKSRIVA